MQTQRQPPPFRAVRRTRPAKLSKSLRQDQALSGEATHRNDRQIRERRVTESQRYPAQVFWSDEDEGFIAVASDLPGCSAFGDTQEEALAELQNAIPAWIDAARKVGNAVPGPSKPASKNQYSGKLLVRMPSQLHEQLALSAVEENVSMNHLVVFLLSTRIAQRNSYGIINILAGPTMPVLSATGLLPYSTGNTAASLGAALMLDARIVHGRSDAI
jgi:predicted RNase H-like HicB family nuclease